MKNILFLIPPSEGKKRWWSYGGESLNFIFKKPDVLLKKASEKDLKCKWLRYEDAKELNKNIKTWPFMSVYERYNGEMFKAISYEKLSPKGKDFFCNHFYIFSWYYWFLKATDIVANYKLPIDAKGLKNFWQKQINDFLIKKIDTPIISLLPESYEKVINKKLLKDRYLRVEFKERKWNKEVRLAHGSKKIKWEFIRNICENEISDLNQFWTIIRDENWIQNLKIYEQK